VGLKTLNLGKFQFERSTLPCVHRFRLLCGTYVHSTSVSFSKQLKIRLNEEIHNNVITSLIRHTQEVNRESKMKNVSINFDMKMSINTEILIIAVCGTQLQEFAH
jgi:hypothetical protein